MITFEQVSRRYGERLALDSVSWHMDEGECVVFLGPSGAGKTSILRLITHELQPSSGTVAVGTFRGGGLRRRQRALLRRTLGIVYEDFRLLGDRTVFENVALAVRIAGQFRDDEVIPRVLFALEEVGLQSKQTAFPLELSYGERQRCAIARAIVNRPAVILADEPTGALEPRSASEIVALLRRIHTEGAALLVTTTRRELAEALPGRIITIEDGKLFGATFPPGYTPQSPLLAAPTRPSRSAPPIAPQPPPATTPAPQPAPQPPPAATPAPPVSPAPLAAPASPVTPPAPDPPAPSSAPPSTPVVGA